MRRFFIDKNNITKGGLVITGKEAHHIKDVIRLRPDDRFIGFDGEGRQYTCRINKIDRNKVEAVIENTQESMLKIPNVTLACAIPKLFLDARNPKNDEEVMIEALEAAVREDDF